MAEDVRHVWSEDELDRALAALNADQQPDKDALLATRADLMAAAGAPAAAVPVRRRRWSRAAGAAAAIVAVAAGLLVFQSSGENAPTAAALNTAADNVTVTDPALEPGQYRYIATHSWYMNSGTDYAVLVEQLHEQWIPREWRDEWLLRREPTGNLDWVLGTAEDAVMDPLQVYPRDEFRGRCGDYHWAEEGRDPCTLAGSWQVPTPAFLAALPATRRLCTSGCGRTWGTAATHTS